jgi:hypothetical protein
VVDVLDPPVLLVVLVVELVELVELVEPPVPMVVDVVVDVELLPAVPPEEVSSPPHASAMTKGTAERIKVQ